MTLSTKNVDFYIQDTLKKMENDPDISPSAKSIITTLITFLSFLLEIVRKNSRNSSKPPAGDPNREKNRRSTGRKSGGQHGHIGVTLTKYEVPDETIIIEVNRQEYPGSFWQEKGYETRQVVDICFERHVTEYQAEILVDQNGMVVTAPFPARVTKAIQYGASVKAEVTYLSQYQLIPYERISEQFSDRYDFPISSGSINNFLTEAYECLAIFEHWVIVNLRQELVLHVDETGVNIDSKRKWLHVVCSPRFTYYLPHAKRGSEATADMGDAILVHDHWKPYFSYTNRHALCNAHHLRELEAAKEDGQKWAEAMIEFLLELDKEVEATGGVLPPERQSEVTVIYREMIAAAEVECPAPPAREEKSGKRGRIAKTKSRNLLERFRDYEAEVLRFMTDIEVSFSNNLAENALRMTKVQQKISGGFRSWQGAQTFCRVRGYLSTCSKHGVSATEALNLLFTGKLPAFITLENQP